MEIPAEEQIMNRKLKALALTALCALALCQPALAQPAPPTILGIELENYVNYFNDVTDYSKLATDPMAQQRRTVRSKGKPSRKHPSRST